MIARHLRTGIIVTLVTAMIWVFAEGASLQRRTRRVEITLVAPPGSAKSLRVTDAAWTGEVDLSLEGSASALDRIESVWREPIVIEPGQPGVPSTPGTHTIELRELLRLRPELRESGASVARCDPPSVVVEADDLVELAAGVQVALPEGEPDAEAIPALDSVKVRLPKRVADGLDPGAVRVIARIDPAALAPAVRGRPEPIRRVRLDAPEALASTAIEIDPARIDVTVTLRTRTASVLLATVPVVIELSALDQARWNVGVPPEDQVLRNVRVTGPADLVGAIERGETRVSAVVSLTFEDLESRVSSKRAEFSRLPTQLRFDAEDRVISLEITPRE